VAVGYERLVRSTLTEDEERELAQVDELAAQLREHLEDSSSEIDAAHVHLAPSGAIQSIASRLLREELGFDEEKRFDDVALAARPRPDFVFRLADGRGILAEVERGGTTTNNHDLKDFWKTHIASDAQHLFLIVPHSNWKQSGAAREKPFKAVARRLAAFFGDPRREVDVVSVHIFGYGRTVTDS
jgi:hypothetical protein